MPRVCIHGMRGCPAPAPGNVPAAQDADSPARSEFGAALRDYLAKLRLPAADAAHAAALVDRHDFSSARGALLPSVPGTHRGAPWRMPPALKGP